MAWKNRARTVLVSFFAAVLICGLLVFSGVLKFQKKPGTNAGKAGTPARTARQSTARAAAPMQVAGRASRMDRHEKKIAEKSPENVPSGLEQQGRKTEGKTDVNAPAAPSGNRAGAGARARSANNIPAGKNNNSLSEENGQKNSSTPYDDAIYFLRTFNSPAGGDVELKFSDFLRSNNKLSDARIEEMLKMAFWKNFVSLQKKWKPGEGEKLSAMFAHEMALKKAGFAAKGLELFSGEISAAIKRMAEIENSLAARKAVPEEGGR